MKRDSVKPMFSLKKERAVRAFRGTIIQVGAFWRGVVEGGVYVAQQFYDEATGEPYPGKGGEQLSRVLEEQLPVWDANESRDGAGVIEQLSGWARERHPFGEADSLVAIMNIYWLERRGLLTPDEHNGLLWHWVIGDAVLTVEQNPLLLDPDKCLKTAIDGTDLGRTADFQGMVKSVGALMDYVRRNPVKD